MARGGQRAGAGRRPVVDIFEQLWIGARCEGMWQAEVDAAFRRASAEWRGQSDLDAVYAKLRFVPVAERAVWLTSDEYEEHSADVEEERRTLAGTADDDESEPPDPFRVRATRPMGKRAPIIEAVSAEAKARFGKPVSTRKVRECWDYHRAALNSG